MTDMIETPKGKIVIDGNGKAELKFNSNFQRFAKQYNRAQMILDNDVLSGCEPFIPLQTGMLIKSGILGTNPGSGIVQWIAIYAKRQYYSGRQPGTSSTGALRGKMWFQRWKSVWGRTEIAKIKRIAGGGS